MLSGKLQLECNGVTYDVAIPGSIIRRKSDGVILRTVAVHIDGAIWARPEDLNQLNCRYALLPAEYETLP